MLQRLAGSAGLVLLAGIVAVGCSLSSDEIVTRNVFDLSNSDRVPANSIAENNLSAGGGGLSPDNADVNSIRIVFCCDSCSSDGPDGSDATVMILFDVNDASGQNRIFACYSSAGGRLSLPTELQAPDRDDRLAPALSSYVAVCLTTAFLTTADAGAQATARANHRKWLIVGNYTTFTNDTRNATRQDTSGVLGPHTALAYWIFDNAQPEGLSTSSQIGQTPRIFENGFLQTGIQIESARGGAATGTGSNGASTQHVDAPACNVTSYGLVSDGFCGQTSFGGTALPLSNSVNTATDVGHADATQYSFAHPNQTGAALSAAAYTMGEQISYLGLFYTQVVSSIADSMANTVGSYTGVAPGLTNDTPDGGAQLQLKFRGFNLATLTFGAEARVDPPASRESQTPSNTTTRAGVGWYPTFHGYNGFAFFKYADASLNKGSTLFTSPNELSLAPTNGGAWSYDNTGADRGRNLARARMHEDIACAVRIADGGAAEAVLSRVGTQPAGVPYDLSLWNTSPGQHDTTNPTNSTTLTAPFFGRPSTAPNREIQNFNLAATPMGQGWRFIFGADEGLGDTTIFYVSADNTRVTEVLGAGTQPGDRTNNQDRALLAAAFNADGSLVAAANGLNPRVVSTHKADWAHNPISSPGSLTSEPGAFNSSINSDSLEDPILGPGQTNGQAGGAGGVATTRPGTATYWFDACLNRTGETIVIAYLQDEGTSVAFRQALKAVAYQTFRTSYLVTLPVAVAQTQFNERFAAAPVDLSARADALDDLVLASVATTAGNNASLAESFNVWTALPVNDYAWQGKVSYRCGFQSDVNVLNVLYEQSDATQDMVYVRAVNTVPDFLSAAGQVSAGTPTIEAGAQAPGALLVSAPGVAGNANYQRRSDHIVVGSGITSTLPPPISSFRFVDGDVDLGTTVQACDLGVNPVGVGGGLLIVWRQITDNTTADNDNGDMGLFAARFGQTPDAVSDITEIGRVTNEDATPAGLQNPTTGAVTGVAFVRDTFSVGVLTATGGVAWNRSANVGGSLTGTTSPGGYDTASVIKLVCVPSNASIETARNYSGLGVYLYFTGPAGDNVSGSRALFTRKLDQTIRAHPASSAATGLFGDRFRPVASSPPTRLDHQAGSNVNNQLDCCQLGLSVGVFFQQAGHVWFQGTADGEVYKNQNRRPNPGLADSDTSVNVNTWRVRCCTNANGDFLNGFFVFTKLDTNTGIGSPGPAGGDLRLRVRNLFGVN